MQEFFPAPLNTGRKASSDTMTRSATCEIRRAWVIAVFEQRRQRTI